ncbi:AKNA factor, partial [Todus mexicanus]|nr:AKNA factor [Todus mexicanus]
LPRVPSLQDDYHKLLTKYAEAENTIDQLRLGARVSLYADPPQPSRSFAVGTMSSGCRALALSIPRAGTAAFGTAPAAASPASPAGAPGPSDGGGSPQPLSHPPAAGGCPTCPGSCRCSGPQLTRTLTTQSHKLQAQARPRGDTQGLKLAGSDLSPLVPQRFRKLKDAQDALERAYLGARQQHPDTSGEFDPDRSVEGAIFRLGLCLEELKERLEPGTRRQLPPQHPAQPRSPPAPSPPPAPCSPHPERTGGDSEAKMGRLPRPLWQKQRRVEEDFGDLLQQYKHFKSLPESLSLERLSLAESGSQEEADGAARGDGGPSKIPCRTRSLEEGADLKTSPLYPPERRPALLSPGETPWPGGPQGHLPPATAEESPATAKPPLVPPEPLRVPQSRRSSGVGSATAQHRPPKVSPHPPAPLEPAGASRGCPAPILLSLQPQDQRIVSPETDSGFVGSEASRVSPPAHIPEHRPPGAGTPSSLGPSIPVPGTLRPLQKREVTPLPSEPALMGIYPGGGPGGTGGPQLPPSTPWQSRCPPRWAESAGSDGAPDGDGTSRRDAAGDGVRGGRGCSLPLPAHPAAAAGAGGTLGGCCCPSPWPLSPGSEAIRALRDEVWRLQRRLEESLRRSRSDPRGKATPRVPPARRQPVTNTGASRLSLSPRREPSPPLRGRVAPGLAPTRRGRSASLPRDRPELDTSKWDPAGVGMEGTAGAWVPGVGAGGQGWLSPCQGPRLRSHWVLAGTRYQAGVPRAAPAPREEPSTPGCPQCHGSQTPSGERPRHSTPRSPRHSTPRSPRCPMCRAPLDPPAPGSRDRATHGPGPGGTSPPGSRAEKPVQPGLWYLLGSPGASAAVSAAVGYLAPVPLVPYAPSVL